MRRLLVTRIGREHSPGRRWLVALLGAASCISATQAIAAPEALPSLWGLPAAKLNASVKPPYALVARPFFGLRSNGVDVVPLDPATMKPLSRSPTVLSCDRVHATPTGEVLCFSKAAQGKPEPGARTTLFVFANDLSAAGQHVNDTQGRPSRARISPDGRFSASAEFTTGHSYVGVGGSTFSTATVIASNDGDHRGENIQDWALLDAGKPVTAVDLNLWGVTFDPANSDRFFVTAYFVGKPYLAEGSIKARRMVVVRPDMECPSFSPDGKRLAFKKRTSATGWSPAVLDLASMKETVFDVANSVDDQIEWLDARTLIYEVVNQPLVGRPSNDLMTLDVSESNPKQQLWLEQARSPTFVRKR